LGSSRLGSRLLRRYAPRHERATLFDAFYALGRRNRLALCRLDGGNFRAVRLGRRLLRRACSSLSSRRLSPNRIVVGSAQRSRALLGIAERCGKLLVANDRKRDLDGAG
jgi:hypothetical protein